MKLYEFAPSRSIRVRWVLQELGLDFEAVTVNLRAGEHRSPEFLKINPAGKLPALVDGDVMLFESVAIVLYLAEKYRSQRKLIPDDVAERAQTYKWLLFAATELEQPLWRMARHTAIYPEPRRLADEVTLAREDFAPMARIANDHLRGRQFVVGNTATIADFVLAYTLDWAGMVHLLDEHAELKKYVEAMYARPKAPMRIAAAFASIDN